MDFFKIVLGKWSSIFKKIKFDTYFNQKIIQNPSSFSVKIDKIDSKMPMAIYETQKSQNKQTERAEWEDYTSQLKSLI